VELRGQLGEVGRALDADLDAVGGRLKLVVGRVDDEVLIVGVEFGVLVALGSGQVGEGEDELLGAAVDGDVGAGGERLRQQGEGLAERSHGLRYGRGRADDEIQTEVRLAGDADLAADEPVDGGVNVDGAGLDGGRGGEGDREGGGVLVAEVHQGAEREAAGHGKLQGSGGDAGGQGPFDVGRLTGVAGVVPIDVPLLFHGEDEASLQGSAGGDGGAEARQLGGEVLGLHGAGAAVADDLQLGARGGDEGAESHNERTGSGELAGERRTNLHHPQL
jgi:hypothetical protein